MVGDKPVSVIGGSEDRLAPPEEVEHLARALKEGGASVQSTILEAGHMIPIEQPIQWRKALLQFLE